MDLIPLSIVLVLATLTTSQVPDMKKTVILKQKKIFKRGGKIEENSTTFRELIENSDMFFDKSTLITKLYEFNHMRVIKILCPQGWLKTTNLHMIKSFYEIEIYPNGTRIPREQSRNYRLFKHNQIVHPNGEIEELRDDLLITQHSSFIESFQGEYPVILLSFANVTASGYDEFVDQIGSAVSEVFKQYTYLENIFDDVSDTDLFREDDTIQQGTNEQNNVDQTEANNQDCNTDQTEANNQNDAEDLTEANNQEETADPNQDNTADQTEANTPDNTADLTEPNNQDTADPHETNTAPHDNTEPKPPSTGAISDIFRKYLEGKATPSELTRSIFFLSKLLHKYFHQHVFVLIDDYDCFFETLFTNELSDEEELKIRQFYASFAIQTLQTNQYLHRGIVIGTYDLDSSLDGFTIAKRLNTSETILYNAFAMTGFEIDSMYRLFPIDGETNRKSRQWYNGYRSGKRLSKRLHEFIPLLKTFAAKNFTYYNMPNVVDNFLSRSLEVKRFRGIIANIVAGKAYLKSMVTNDHSEIMALKKLLLHSGTEIDNEVRKSYLTLLYASGYFTAKKNFTDFCVQVPNHRVKYKLADILMNFYIEKYNIPFELIEKVVTNMYSFMNNDELYGTEFTSSLQEFFQIFPLHKDIYDFHLLNYVIHYFALEISTISNYRMLDLHTEIMESIAYVVLYSPQRKVIIGVKMASMINERMLPKLHKYENNTIYAFTPPSTKVIALGIPPEGDYQLFYSVLVNQV